jgi:hypothetical protein
MSDYRQNTSVLNKIDLDIVNPNVKFYLRLIVFFAP